MKRPRCIARRGRVGLSRAPLGAWARGPNPEAPSPNPNTAPDAGLDFPPETPREVGGHGRTWGRGIGGSVPGPAVGAADAEPSLSPLLSSGEA